MTDEKKPLTYKDAGVDIAAGARLVDAIKPLTARTARPGSDADLGGFGGLFDLRAAGFEDPILVAATDGVGTKLRLALEAGHHDTVGIDLVAMCVNDLIVQGAEPLFFLDYMATGKLLVERMTDVVAGIAEGCRQAGAALIGGETAEMPGMYAGEDYDLAGFAVGAAERGQILNGQNICEGDVLIGLASSGPHSNGYSLIRRIVERSGAELGGPAPFDTSITLAGALLTPTRIYVQDILPLVRSGAIKAMAHITGGGFLENLPRILPRGLTARVDADSWELPPVFEWLRGEGNLSPQEMAQTFNCGVGMVLALEPGNAPAVLEALGSGAFTIGNVESNESDKATCIVTGPAGTWGSDADWRAAFDPDEAQA